MASTTAKTLATAPRSAEVTLATGAHTSAVTVSIAVREIGLTITTAFVISTDRVFNSRFSDRFKKT